MKISPRVSLLFIDGSLLLFITNGLFVAGISSTRLPLFSRSPLTFVSPPPPLPIPSSSAHPSFSPLPSSASTSCHSQFVSTANASNKQAISIEEDVIDFKCSRMFLFPGQGAQMVGMATETAAVCAPAKELFTRASSLLGYDLLQTCEEGPKAVLDSTAVCQPAIFVSSMAAVERLKQEKQQEEEADACMGLSLGEYSALCYAGAISFDDGVKLTQERGAAMQAAAEEQPSGMVSVIGVKSIIVEDMCEQVRRDTNEHVVLANYLCDGNYVVSGSTAACEEIEKVAKLPPFKARMTVRLPVAGAFHTRFMSSAVDRLRVALQNVDIRTPRIPVVSNVDAKAHSDAGVIKQLLLRQVTSPVQWEKSVQYVLDRGMQTAYELGPGSVLAGIFKRMDKTKPITSVH
eukprot:GHVS01004911.1.p1 GENE.GHVS01004911.1~~GHVS01004911.1.p1  ORF type:complete len:403 (+),score=82.61 GHVS01004911.1:178-1386(+)